MRTVAEARERGVDVIALGIGDPDTPPPAELREELCAQARRDEIHGYPTNLGIAPLREAVAAPLPQPLRRGARSRARDPAAAGREGRPRAPLPRPARSRRRRAGRRSRLPGLLRRAGAGGRRGRRPAPARRERLPARPRGHRRAADAAGRPADLRLSEQPDGSGRRPRVLRAPGRLGRRARRADLPRQRLCRADLRRPRGAELPGGAGRARGRNRDLLALQVALAARLADRIRGRQRRADRPAAHAQDEHRLRHVARAAARGDHGASS